MDAIITEVFCRYGNFNEKTVHTNIKVVQHWLCMLHATALAIRWLGQPGRISFQWRLKGTAWLHTCSLPLLSVLLTKAAAILLKCFIPLHFNTSKLFDICCSSQLLCVVVLWHCDASSPYIGIASTQNSSHSFTQFSESNMIHVSFIPSMGALSKLYMEAWQIAI